MLAIVLYLMMILSQYCEDDVGSGSAKGGGELGGAGSETCDGEVGRVGIGWYGHADGGGDDGGVGAGDEDGRVSRGGVGDGDGDGITYFRAVFMLNKIPRRHCMFQYSRLA